MFHIRLKFEGAGRSTINEFTGANSWLDLRRDFGIVYQVQEWLTHDLNFTDGKHDGELKWRYIIFIYITINMVRGMTAQFRGARWGILVLGEGAHRDLQHQCNPFCWRNTSE